MVTVSYGLIARAKSESTGCALQDPSLRRLVAAIRSNSTEFEAGGRVLRLKQCAPMPPARSSRPRMQKLCLRSRLTQAMLLKRNCHDCAAMLTQCQ